MLSRGEVDLSEVEGRSFLCVEGCGLCCLCQPELMPDESLFFQESYPEKLVWIEEPHPHLAISTREGGGPCTFLHEGRCSVYQHRPRFCRQFPFHFYLGERVQVELDLSCRGVWGDQGEDAAKVAWEMLDGSRDQLDPLLVETRKNYHEFWRNCELAGVGTSLSKVREDLERIISAGIDLNTLARMLESSAEEAEISLPLDSKEMTAKEMADLEMASMDNALSSLESESPHAAPIYCDPKGRWHLFEVREDELHWQVMGKGGELLYMRPIDPLSVSIGNIPLTESSVLRHYLHRLNRRDSFLGHVCFLEDMYSYEDYIANTYIGSFATSALDLIWRASLIGLAFEIDPSENLMREGVIFYDMDRLGTPTIGAFF